MKYLFLILLGALLLWLASLAWSSRRNTSRAQGDGSSDPGGTSHCDESGGDGGCGDGGGD